MLEPIVGTLPTKEECGDCSRASVLLEHFRCPLNLLEFRNHGGSLFGALDVFFASGSDPGSRGILIPARPIDDKQVIDNLRFERYCQHKKLDRIFCSTYYLFRSMLPLSIRKLIHQAVFRKRQKTFPNWPLDYTVELILEFWMEKAIEACGLSEMPFIWFWPDGHGAAFMMTHDIEEEAGVGLCRMLMDLDDSAEVPAAFQVIPEGRYGKVEELITEIRARGFEVNLHDLDHDGRLYEHLHLFEKRAKKINMYAERYGTDGFRAGSMHRNQDWLKLLKVQYDMSVPNVARLEPQSGGCCTVTPYFVGNILELPLTTVQDHALFYILKERSINLWKEQIEGICSHHGLISFIVHPDYIVNERERHMYRELLEHISSVRSTRAIWVALPGEVNKWWRQRSQMQLVETPRGWKVEGEGSERARIAYAHLVDGKLTYRIDGHRNQTGDVAVQD